MGFSRVLEMKKKRARKGWMGWLMSWRTGLLIIEGFVVFLYISARRGGGGLLD